MLLLVACTIFHLPSLYARVALHNRRLYSGLDVLVLYRLVCFMCASGNPYSCVWPALVLSLCRLTVCNTIIVNSFALCGTIGGQDTTTI